MSTSSEILSLTSLPREQDRFTKLRALSHPVPVIYNHTFIQKSGCSQSFFRKYCGTIFQSVSEGEQNLLTEAALIAVLKRAKSIILRPSFDLHEVIVDFFIFDDLPFQTRLKIILSISFENSGGQGSTKPMKRSFENANILTICIFPSNE